MENNNLFNEFWDHIETTKETSRQAKLIYNWLNRDNLSDIITDDKVYWFELTSSTSSMPDYIYDYLKNWLNKKGYTYLYDMPTTF